MALDSEKQSSLFAPQPGGCYEQARVAFCGALSTSLLSYIPFLIPGEVFLVSHEHPGCQGHILCLEPLLVCGVPFSGGFFVVLQQTLYGINRVCMARFLRAVCLS